MALGDKYKMYKGFRKITPFNGFDVYNLTMQSKMTMLGLWLRWETIYMWELQIHSKVVRFGLGMEIHGVDSVVKMKQRESLKDVSKIIL